MTSLSCGVENSNSSLDEDSGCSERCKAKHNLQLLNIKTSTAWFLNNLFINYSKFFSKIYYNIKVVKLKNMDTNNQET